jgi:hypothetical protein
MGRPTQRRIARGSALAVSIILIGVLTVIGVAAVSLSTQERSNAAAYGRVDGVYACANAAVAKLWSEMAAYGTGLAGSGVAISSIRLPDGTVLTAPAHYDTFAGGGSPTISSVVRSAATFGAMKKEGNLTNTMRGTVEIGQGQILNAHCKDAFGRELEIEIVIRFAL